MATAGPWLSLSGVSLHPKILHAVTHHLKFPTMTPVQASAIPPLLSAKDVCVQAETGSGKTLSFLLPLAQLILFSDASPSTPRLKPSRSVRAIVLLPTRELALQVHAVAERLFSHIPGDVVPVPLIGGASSHPTLDLSHIDDHRLIIATPGRLAASLVQGELHCSHLDILVIDEADRLLHMGFSVALTDILTRLPKQRRTGMYSATQTTEVDALARAGMRNPVRVVVRVQSSANVLQPSTSQSRVRIPPSVSCYHTLVSPRDKLATLMQHLANHPDAKVIVYFLTCACVEYFRLLPLQQMLSDTMKATECDGSKEVGKERKFFTLHGQLNQKRRQRNLAGFASSEAGVLLCTDVAARGIDIADVDWVIQFDIPQDPDAYIHRVGRTGRLGREGNALLFISEWEDCYLEFLAVRKCPVAEWTPSESRHERDSERVKEVVRSLVRGATLGDRAVLEASERAFLTYVRAYKEHKCCYLLKVTDVDFNSLGDGFGLLRLPRFYEFRKVKDKIEGRNQEGVVIRDIGFKDKNRERRRQGQIAEAIANRGKRREMLQAKSKKKKKKRKKGGQEDEESGSGKTGKAGDEEYEEYEDDFSMEAMQLRKLKKGKISGMQFDAAAGYDEEFSLKKEVKR